MESCKCCVFFEGMSYCHYHECECSDVLYCNDNEKEVYEEDYLYLDCFSEDDLL